MPLDTRPIVMAIDDDPVILNMTVIMLRHDYRLRPFTSGAMAFKYLSLPEQTADLVLLDNNMPGISGPEVLRTLRSNEALSHIPVIFMTGLVDEQDRYELIRQGADDVINKPPPSSELLKMIDKHMRGGVTP